MWSNSCSQFGLTTNLRNLKWYEEADHYTFFPRSHLLGSDDEKMDFIGMPMEVLIKFVCVVMIVHFPCSLL